MLPSEKAERWVRRIGYLALILILLFVIWWLVGFVGRTTRSALEQREAPPEARRPTVETSGA